MMPDDVYHIKIKNGHNKRLRFWFAPVSDKIMNARADWLDDAELSCDNISTKELVYPFIKKHFPGEFKWRNELNLMPFENALAMAREMRRVSKLMKRNFTDPRLASYKRRITIDLLVSEQEYEERFANASERQKRAAVADHIGVVTEFYTAIADYIEDTVEEYEPKGFHSIAIYAPH